ncbi:hypothetical protein mRhiFer1_009002 [Rhinolophus ferrumequinum]|uniref:Uncharacterized protein n=1 Tax=Rhinolophus ferrumequinum TaxID=59479 RepID=A0A7J7TE36_RHIFE|nr:hypothetical protein mRhiFer1_009002 [Rhinolophus ferrumequinum]
MVTESERSMVLAVVSSSFQHLDAPRSALDRSSHARQLGCCPGGRIHPGHSGLLLCPRPSGISPRSCSLCPGHCYQTAWPEARGPARGWRGSHALPTGSRVALQNAVSLSRAREWAQASPCPLGSFRLVLGLLSARRRPQARGPHHPYLKVCGCISLTDSARPRSFPSPWGLGRLLPGWRCWSQGGQHERWGAFRPHPC